MKMVLSSNSKSKVKSNCKLEHSKERTKLENWQRILNVLSSPLTGSGNADPTYYFKMMGEMRMELETLHASLTTTHPELEARHPKERKDNEKGII